MRKLFKHLFLTRLLTAQLPALAILATLISGQVFRAPILVQVCFFSICISLFLLNLYFADQVKKEKHSSGLGGQLFFTILTFAVMLQSAYRYLTVTDDVQKLIALLSTILLFILFLLLAWGIKYAWIYQQKKK